MDNLLVDLMIEDIEKIKHEIDSVLISVKDYYLMQMEFRKKRSKKYKAWKRVMGAAKDYSIFKN